MDIYLKVTAGILVTAILSVILSKQGKDMALLLSLCVCSMVALAAATYLQPVLTLARKLTQIGQLNYQWLDILLKVAGIGILSQVAVFVCNDAGNQSLAKSLQIITTAVLLSISVPLLEEILSLLEVMLGEV